ncbi:tRNA (N6-threonylcarbamoyladenosine(37)-N6)-methyltransferase TrmO [candidate division WOR-3 bacterium]|nr:tRNA (N6-threonylcarbamoyladenosine(37)-N6)-methyltransferase TrmO [candidate division WOR-3 bacterium]
MRGSHGELSRYSQYAKGLADIDGFSYLYVLWLFHKSGKDYKLEFCPTRERIPPPRGLFATRSPHRINPIGLTIVRLLKREGNILHVKGVDMVDGTPVLDIKPYTRRDRKSRVSNGWIDQVKRKAM